MKRFPCAMAGPRADAPTGLSTFDFRLSTFDLSTFDLRPSTFDLRPSTFDVDVDVDVDVGPAGHPLSPARRWRGRGMARLAFRRGRIRRPGPGGGGSGRRRRAAGSWRGSRWARARRRLAIRFGHRGSSVKTGRVVLSSSKIRRVTRAATVFVEKSVLPPAGEAVGGVRPAR
jgi:hypothetical protein